MSGWGGGNSLSGADSGLSFEREEGPCVRRGGEGEAADVKGRDKTCTDSEKWC